MSDVAELLLICRDAEHRIAQRKIENEKDRAIVNGLRLEIYRKCQHQWIREAVRNELSVHYCKTCGLYKV